MVSSRPGGKKDCGCTEIAAQNERSNLVFDPNDTVKIKYVGAGDGRFIAQYKYRDYYLPTGEVKDIPRELALKLLDQDVFVLVEEEPEEVEDESGFHGLEVDDEDGSTEGSKK